MTQWSVPARLEFYTAVLIEAETEAEALAKFDAGGWIDNGLDCAECVNWVALGKAKAER